MVGIALVALLAVGALDALVNGGKIYNGVHIGSIDASGMTVEEAAASIEEVYGEEIFSKDVDIFADEATMKKAKAGQEIEDLQDNEYVSVDEAAQARKAWSTNATMLQARIYPEEIAQEAYAVGRDEGGIGARITAQTFGWDINPSLHMSDTAIERLASSIDRSMGDPHVDYDIEIVDAVATVTEGRVGKEVNRDTLRAEIASRLLGVVEDNSFVATIEDAPIRITKEAAQALADRINKGIENGATFIFDTTTWEAASYDLAYLIVTDVSRAEDGSWVINARYDETEAKNVILSNLQSAFNKQNVKVEFQKEGENITVKTDATGTMPEVGKAVKALEQATLETTPESTPKITVEGAQIPASMTIDEALDYGIISTISSYETEYTAGATNRNTNIHLAADLLDNSIIKANGGTWSFNGTAGECNEEKGFKGAGVIVGGEIVDDIGGGICQVATTVFNAVYEAGLPVDERSNHSLYIASYPAGRDAAISWPDPDLAWHNDTNSDILLQTSYDEETITVTLLGVDPGYTVESVEGEFKDGEKHSVRTEYDDSLAEGETQVKQAGVDGSTIEVIRTVRDASGNIVRKDTFSSVYDAQDEIILVGPNTDVDSSLLSESDDDEYDEDDSESEGESEEDAGYEGDDE